MANPPIDPKYVGDDTALGATIDTLLRADPRIERHVEELLRRQRRLQELSSEDGWSSYLDVEREVSARNHFALLLVTRWAWAEGRAYERRRRGEP